jgi:predicted PurR-regulated permease PerM
MSDNTPLDNEITEPASDDQASQANLHVDVGVSHLRVPSVVLATLAVLTVLLLAYLVYRTLPLLLLLFVALLFATAIEPLVKWLRRGPFNRSAGILVVYTAIFLLLGTIGYVTLPVVFEQVGELSGSLSKTVGDMRKGVDDINNPFLRQQATVFVDAAEATANQLGKPSTPTSDTEKVQQVTETTLTVAEVFFGVITLFVVAYYWLTERILIKRSLMTWLPVRRANRVRRVWDDIEVKVGGWVRGQLVLMAIVGVLSAIGYFVIGVQYWPALALFIAIAEAIPLVGPYIGTAPALLVALTQQPDGGVGKALMVIGFAIVLQTIEGNVLVPRVMRNSVGVSPLTVLISILFGATLAGLAGALVAVPIAASIQVIVQDIKAAHESEEKFEEETEEAKETREEAGELVVAFPAGGETKTKLESEAKASN